MLVGQQGGIESSAPCVRRSARHTSPPFQKVHPTSRAAFKALKDASLDCGFGRQVNPS